MSTDGWVFTAERHRQWGPAAADRAPEPAGTGSVLRPLSGRVAIVTGGSSGIGRAVAEALVEHGVHVILVGQTPERVQAVSAALRACATPPAQIVDLALDVRQAAHMERMVEETLRRFGRVDLLVHAAGITRQPRSGHMLPYPVVQTPTAEWDAIIDTNLRGTFLANHAVLPAMLGERSGTIVNVASSPAGYRGQAFAAAYCASKFGVRGLSQSLAAEVADAGIRVHAIFPDAIDTPMLDRSTLASRLGEPLPPRRVADLVLMMWTLPPDACVIEPILMPARRPAFNEAGRGVSGHG
jgi:NAD(P)-dependent dehydrogenase (short-subunit alcohol dehydrogenase family)